MTGPVVSWSLERPVAKPLWREPGPKHLAPHLLARWAGALETWGASAATGRALGALANQDTAVVVTGQQPGVWGGPAYSLYKAATAIALAEHITASTGKPAVAVFWMQADDTDWDEAGWGTLLRPDLSLYRTRWHPSPLAPRQWVGGATPEFPADAVSVLEAWGVDTIPGAPRPDETIDIASGFVQLLLRYFGDRGLLPLDGRWDEVRQGGEELWKGYHQRHSEIAASVVAEGTRLTNPGTDPPLDAEAADHGLFVLEGDRRLPIDGEGWEADVSRRLAGGMAHELAPSVLLRAPLQDHLFGSTAQVVGHSEASYLEQLAPLYQTLDIPVPARVPRLRATLVPTGRFASAALQAVIDDPDHWVSERAREKFPPAARTALDNLRTALHENLKQLIDVGADFSKDMEQIGGAARRKIEIQLNRLEETLDRRARQELYRETPEVRQLPEFLRPRRGDQERGLSGAGVSLFLGDRAPEAILEAAAAHVTRLEEGELHHFVLEGGL